MPLKIDFLYNPTLGLSFLEHYCIRFFLLTILITVFFFHLHVHTYIYFVIVSSFDGILIAHEDHN